MLELVELDEAIDPVQVGFFCTKGVVMPPENVPNFVEQLLEIFIGHQRAPYPDN